MEKIREKYMCVKESGSTSDDGTEKGEIEKKYVCSLKYKYNTYIFKSIMLTRKTHIPTETKKQRRKVTKTKRFLLLAHFVLKRSTFTSEEKNTQKEKLAQK